MLSKLIRNAGFTLIEMLVSMAIFSVIMTAIFSVYSTQVKHTGREYRIAESEVEMGIAKGIMEKDLAMAGYGLAEDYAGLAFDPRAVGVTSGNPDILTLMGTSLGMNSKETQGWTYMANTAPTFATWNDAREDLGTDTRVIVIQPVTRRIMTEGTEWLYWMRRNEANADDRLRTVASGTTITSRSVGNIVYGLHPSGETDATQPYYAVRYQLDRTDFPLPSNCESATFNLIRFESRTSSNPTLPADGTSLLSCVLDMEVALGLDTDDDGNINLWDGGTQAAGYDAETLNRRLKQVRVYLLIQVGRRDTDYSASTPVWLGDSAAGRNVNLSASQRSYRWRVLTLNITPRNMR